MKRLKCYYVSYQVTILDDLGYWANRDDLNHFSIIENEAEVKRVYERGIRRYMDHVILKKEGKYNFSLRKSELNTVTVTFYFDGTPGLTAVITTLDLMNKVKEIMLDSLNWAIKFKEETINNLKRLRDEFVNEYKPTLKDDKFEEIVKWDDPNPYSFEIGDNLTCYEIMYTCYINELTTPLGYKSKIEDKNKLLVDKGNGKVITKTDYFTKKKATVFDGKSETRWMSVEKDKINTFEIEFDRCTDIPYLNGYFTSLEALEKAKEVMHNAFNEAIRRAEDKLSRLLEKKRLYLEEQGMEDIEYKDYPKGYHYAFPTVIKLADKDLNKRIYSD